jgi:hypothetical protein
VADAPPPAEGEAESSTYIGREDGCHEEKTRGKAIAGDDGFWGKLSESERIDRMNRIDGIESSRDMTLSEDS